MTVAISAASALASLALVFLLVRRLPARWQWVAGAAVAWTLGWQLFDKGVLPHAFADLEPRRHGLRGETPEVEALLDEPFTPEHARIAYAEGYLSLNSYGQIQQALRHKQRWAFGLAGVLGLLVGVVGRAIGSWRQARRNLMEATPEAPPKPQVAGMPCAVCDERIVTRLDGRTCGVCERPLHSRCARAHSCEEET